MQQNDASRTSIPSKVPSSGSGGTPYIIASIALVVLITGMLWYKFRPAPTPPQLPVIRSATPTNSVAAALPAFDLPPPPELDSGADAEVDSGPKKVASGGNPLCGMQCEGTNTAALDSALRGAAGSARGCYERALRSNSMLQGRLKMAMRIAANGTVCSASVVEDSLHSPEVSSCVLGLLRGRPYPAPAGGSCVDVSIPVSFTPQEKK